MHGYGYPWIIVHGTTGSRCSRRISRAIMDILVDIHGKPRMPMSIPMQNLEYGLESLIGRDATTYSRA